MQRHRGGQQLHRVVRTVGMPAAAARPQQTGGRVVRTTPAQEDAQLGDALAGVGVGLEVRQMGRVQREGRPFELPGTTRATLALGDRLGDGQHGVLGLAHDQPVEGRALVLEVGGAHGDVIAGDGDRRVGMMAADALGDEDRGGVLLGRPAGDHDEVGAERAQALLGAVDEGLARFIVGRVPELGLEVEHVDVVAGPAKLGEEADELGLDGRALGPGLAVE